jgi:tRNA U55 pseudouridine synthase TruB
MGEFIADQATLLEHLSPESLIPLTTALKHLPTLYLSPELEQKIRMGQAISSPQENSELSLLLSEQGNIVALAKQTTKSKGSFLQPVIVIPKGDC